jgi:hypothetical protein
MPLSRTETRTELPWPWTWISMCGGTSGEVNFSAFSSRWSRLNANSEGCAAALIGSA